MISLRISFFSIFLNFLLILNSKNSKIKFTLLLINITSHFPKKEFLNKDDLLQFYDTFSFDPQPNKFTRVLNIPANVLSIQLPLPYPNLKLISVDSNNCVFQSIDGILYSKNLDQLICIPPKHSSSKYELFSSIKSICDLAFSICRKLESILVESNNQQFSSIDGILFSKNLDTILCFPAKRKFSSYCIPTSVTTIGNSAFSSCSNLKSITIPTRVKSIGDSSFIYCSNLQSITIPTSVVSIGDYVFAGCCILRSITIPTSVTSIGNSAFVSCSNLESITVESTNLHFASSEGILFTKDFATIICFPSNHQFCTYNIPTSVTSISNSAFYKCSKLRSITIPTSVTSIGNSAFYGCLILRSITIPASVTSIVDSVFYQCSKLQSITIPTSVTSIGSSAFARCTSLHSVTIPTSVTSIGDSAFSFCGNLQSITIPGSVTSIGDSAFSYCQSLQSIDVDCNNSQYLSTEGIVFSKDYNLLVCFPSRHHLSHYTIPASVTTIDDSAFYLCSKLQSITIPTKVTRIGNYAFSGCENLQSITIPASVTTIGDSAFSDCINLNSISMPDHFRSCLFLDFQINELTEISFSLNE